MPTPISIVRIVREAASLLALLGTLYIWRAWSKLRQPNQNDRS
ncbi:hypothetical protein [Azospirillum cavernae]|nr:hypothetical protein [Azospirillum cavernae]